MNRTAKKLKIVCFKNHISSSLNYMGDPSRFLHRFISLKQKNIRTEEQERVKTYVLNTDTVFDW